MMTITGVNNELDREPIFINVPGESVASRELRPLREINKPVGVGKDDCHEIGIEVLNTRPDYMGRTLSIKLSIVECIIDISEFSLHKQKKILTKLYDRCTPKQQEEFRYLYGTVEYLNKNQITGAFLTLNRYVFGKG